MVVFIGTHISRRDSAPEAMNMSKGIGSVHVKFLRGNMNVIGQGQTPRGQRYIKNIIPLECRNIGAKKFKKELADAVNEMLA